jgi:PAS domain S-box-containing protein
MTPSDLNPETILALRNEAVEADSTGVAILSASDHLYQFLDVNGAFLRITGYAAAEILGRPYGILGGPRTSTESLDAIKLALDQRQGYSGTIVTYGADNAPQWVHVSVTFTCEAHGGLEYVLFTIRDATAFVRARTAQDLIREISACIRRTPRPSDATPEVARLMVPAFTDWCAIHMLNEEGVLSLAALAHATLPAPGNVTGVDVEGQGIGAVTASGITLRHQPSDPTNPALAQQMSAMLGMPVHAVLTVPIATDATHIFGAITWATTDDKREFADADVEIAEDIGARVGYHHDTFRQREDLALTVRSRESFLSVAGHELRTPVVSIKGYAQLLLRDIRRKTLSPQRLENGLHTIESAAEKLSALTEDLFTVYNRGSATVPLSLSTVKLDTYLREFFSTSQAHLLHGHVLELSGIHDTGWVSIDVVRFAQVLYNLMNNAERFSPPTAPIRISTSRRAHGAIISVADNGKGLAHGEEKSIFDPFVTSRRNSAHTEAGLGISLYISHQIVQRHKGRIWAESDGPDLGATFKVFLPVVPDPAS